MELISTAIKDAFVVKTKPIVDERGDFTTLFVNRIIEEKGLSAEFVQSNLARNHFRGTMRGMHMQEAPHMQTKLIRCQRGAVFDVAVDVRRDSPSYLRWTGAELTGDGTTMLYVPAGCLHGYLTLTDHAEVFYQVSAYYAPNASIGYRWDDPAFKIEWPIKPTNILPRDQDYPLYQR